METFLENYKNNGFSIEEDHFRRLIHTIEDRFSNLGQTPIWSFLIVLVNGSQIKTDNIDEVLFENNSGSSRISSLRINCHNEDRNTKIEISLSDLSLKNNKGKPITYEVLGLDKDWVIITNSIIEERLDTIKRFSVLQLTETKSIFLLILILTSFVTILFFIIFSDTIEIKSLHELLIEEKAQGNLNDPVDVMIMIEKIKEDNKLNLSKQLIPTIIKTSILMTILLGIQALLIGIYPSYAFCWGEYKGIFIKKDKRAKLTITVVFIGILVSMAGSILAKMLF